MLKGPGQKPFGSQSKIGESKVAESELFKLVQFTMCIHCLTHTSEAFKKLSKKTPSLAVLSKR